MGATNQRLTQSNLSTDCRKRLTAREQHLADIKTQVDNKSITLIGFVGWGDGCIKKIPQGTPGVSQYHSVIYEKNGVRVVETLGSAISVFNRPLNPILSSLSALAIPTDDPPSPNEPGFPQLPNFVSAIPEPITSGGRVYRINPNVGLDTGLFVTSESVAKVPTKVLVIDLTQSTFTTTEQPPQQTEESIDEGLVIPYAKVTSTYTQTMGHGAWKPATQTHYLQIKKSVSNQPKPQWITGVMCNKTCLKDINRTYAQSLNPTPTNDTSVTFPVPMIYIFSMLVPTQDGSLIRMTAAKETEGQPKKSGIWWPINDSRWLTQMPMGQGRDPSGNQCSPNQFMAEGSLFSIDTELQYVQP